MKAEADLAALPEERAQRPVRDVLLRFVNDELLGGLAPAVDADTPLFEDGRIDSLKLLQLLAFLEQNSGRKIPDELIEIGRFRTLEVIARNFLSP